MNLDDTTRSTNYVLPLIAVTIACATYAMWGRDRAVAALVGGGVALLNWWALRWLGKRVMQEQTGRGLAFGLLLTVKMAALMAIVFILVHRLALDPIGLVLGLTSLCIAPLLTAALGAGQSRPKAAQAASEER